MNRRTFLRVLGSAAVGSVVAQVIPAPIAEALESGPSTWWRSQAIGHSEPLSLDVLRRAFEACSKGGAGLHPHYWIVSASAARQYGLIYDVEIAA